MIKKIIQKLNKKIISQKLDSDLKIKKTDLINLSIYKKEYLNDSILSHLNLKQLKEFKNLIPVYPNIDKYPKAFNFYEDLHIYFLLHKFNYFKYSVYPDYINNLKNKNTKKFSI